MGGLTGIAVATSIQYGLSSLLLGLLFHRRMASRLRSSVLNPVQSIFVSETSGRLS